MTWFKKNQYIVFFIIIFSFLSLIISIFYVRIITSKTSQTRSKSKAQTTSLGIGETEYLKVRVSFDPSNAPSGPDDDFFFFQVTDIRYRLKNNSLYKKYFIGSNPVSLNEETLTKSREKDFQIPYNTKEDKVEDVTVWVSGIISRTDSQHHFIDYVGICNSYQTNVTNGVYDIIFRYKGDPECTGKGLIPDNPPFYPTDTSKMPFELDTVFKSFEDKKDLVLNIYFMNNYNYNLSNPFPRPDNAKNGGLERNIYFADGKYYYKDEVLGYVSYTNLPYWVYDISQYLLENTQQLIVFKIHERFNSFLVPTITMTTPKILGFKTTDQPIKIDNPCFEACEVSREKVNADLTNITNIIGDHFTSFN